MYFYVPKGVVWLSFTFPWDVLGWCLRPRSGATGIIWIWARVNGTNVVDSATKIAVQGTAAETVAARNFLLDMNAGDYFELMWSTDDTNVQILAGVS